MANYFDYYIVMEETTPAESKIEILSDKGSSGNLNFLRFTSVMQTFNGRNRNRRLWRSRFVKDMLASSECQEMLRKGWPGENGHPILQFKAEPSLERILTIDPNNISHKMCSFEWVGDTVLKAVIETLDDIDGPGAKFARHIMQGLEPAFSCRAVVPQRKNPDGSSDVIGSGRLVTYDRIFLPSHKEAYRDIDVPVKNVVKKPQFDVLMESAISFTLSKSDKVNYIIDNFDPVLESTSFDINGTLSMKTGEGTVIINPEKKIRDEIKDFMKTLY